MSFNKFHPTIRIRLLLLFITSLATMAVIPYLIIYLSHQVGTLITGILFLFVMLANVIGSLLGGFISDRIGRKKVILSAELIIFLGFIGVAFANSPWYLSPYVTFVFFLFIQFSSGSSLPVYQALIIDITSPEDRRTVYTYSYWIRNTAIAIGSLLGAFLFFDYPFYLFLGVALCTLISVFITFFFIQETYTPNIEANHEKTNSSVKRIIHSYRIIFSHRAFTIFSIASLFIISVEEQLTNYIGVRLTKEINDPVPFFINLSWEIDGANLLGLLKAENTLLVVFLTVIIGRVMQKFKDRSILLIGLLFFFVGYVVISFNTTPYILILAMLLASIGEIMYMPIKQTLLANLVPNESRSTYLAFYEISSIIGISTAGIFMIISSWLPAIVLTLMMGIMGIISITIFYKLTKDQ
ncbi:MFS transporter [Psychrobacillus sp. FSL K6-2684]|uniref:MDR family MFS transporter n=1 Tax=unclassified Psychrobacillus TaxID=2636677 RepID=UPI001244F719|nr:MFS transporter [Psychrobacillus sp. AK 1817]QEY20022.1 MFS transporter [Psychrobacillus sp. AK 1817]